MIIHSVAAVAALLPAVAGTAHIAFQERPGELVITARGQPLATYVYADKEITRPYFAHVHVPGGVQITRHHPPIEGQDLTDHATFHPGIWLAFGDINGQDFWRIKAPVRHVKFVQPPHPAGATGTFVVENSYRRADNPNQVVCHEICRYTIKAQEDGYLLVSDSVFWAPEVFTFGDQEEMGLGVRVATPISVKSGGHMLDAAGRVDEKEIWSKSSAWCDYSGKIGGRQVGILVMPDPVNFRPARFHARDYGLLAANPFGQKVFGEAQESRVTVQPGELFRLRFGVLLHASDDGTMDLPAAYQSFLREIAAAPRPAP